MTEGGKRRVDRVMAPSYLDGLDALALPDLRERRSEAGEEEAILSYERRLLHARLDILRAEIERRRSGDSTASLIERLPQILADEPSEGRGAFPTQVPPVLLENPRRRVERLVSDDTLARLADLSDEEVASAVTAIEETEAEVSETRRAVQGVLDALTGELAGRYRSGEADAGDLLVVEP